jgi:hypothetical protein
MKALKIFLFALTFIWQLPQSLIGLAMLIYFKIFGYVKLISFRHMCLAYEAECMSGGISLGNFAFLSPNLAKKEAAIAHEQLGHTWDSHLMGPLYLLIVGLPSLLNAAFDITECYYSWFPEVWANRHAGVEVYENQFGRCDIRMKE